MSLRLDTTDITLRIGARVRAARMRAGLSQQTLGAALGITFQQVQKYEKGANRIAVATLHRIADAVGTPIASLLDPQAPLEGGHDVDALAQLASRDNLRLLAAFGRIADPKVKASLLAMAESLSRPLDA